MTCERCEILRRELETAVAEIEQLRKAGNALVAAAKKAAALNDADHVTGNIIKAHKILLALAGGRAGYMAELDQAHAVIAAKPPAGTFLDRLSAAHAKGPISFTGGLTAEEAIDEVRGGEPE